MKATLISLYRRCFGEKVESISEIKAHASERRIFRLRGRKHVAIGISNNNIPENRAFIEFTRHFLRHGLPVPKLYAMDMPCGIYLLEDLGDLCFLDFLQSNRSPSGDVDPKAERLLMKIVKMLPRFQLEGADGPHLDFCFQSRVFDHSSVLRDARYFEKEFLGRTTLDYDLVKFDADIERLARFMEGAGSAFFMYRDFQSRNIMIRDEEPYFIDYQGGRLGPLQYDIVSLLYQSKARLPQTLRDRAVEEYLSALQELTHVDVELFRYYFDAFVLIRLMQVLATYGQQGLGQGKLYFKESIPLAIENLRNKVAALDLPVLMDEMLRVFEAMIECSDNGNLLKGE